MRMKPRTTASFFRRRLQLLVLSALTWCIVWIILSIEWIRRVDHKYQVVSSNTSRLRSSTYMYGFLPLTAYVEPAAVDSKSSDSDSDSILDLRTHGPEQLLKFSYPLIKSCDDLPSKLPVFHNQDRDIVYGPNVHNSKPLFDKRLEYAESTCPVDADPFLPWIHDVFPSNDGMRIEFVAHNKRRCNTDPEAFASDLTNLEPQIALMQPVPVTTISAQEVRSKVPESLWSRDDATPRYRLATSFEEATAQETRFICQFHRLINYPNVVEGTTITASATTSVKKQVVGETLSIYPYNYELANFRKPGSKPMLSRPNDDKKHSAHNEQVWNSVLHFSCPVPKHLQGITASGETVVSNNGGNGDVRSMTRNKPTLFLDLVPIRTKARLTRDGYFPRQHQLLNVSAFDPRQAWGDSHVLPEVDSSGRWSHIPICLPPRLSSLRQQPLSTSESVVATTDANEVNTAAGVEDAFNNDSSNKQKEHFLVGCTWAAASFSTRGQASKDTSTSSRLFEWLTYHLEIAGFDHVFVYDNTESTTLSENTTSSSLEHITNLFPGKVTRVQWPHRVCNNNKPSNKNAGERSSQYAAETSCRVRHGPNAEWMIFFDNDEYLIPQGKWSSIRQWLKEGVGKESLNHILSFYQSRAVPRLEYMEESATAAAADGHQQQGGHLSKRSNVTFLQTYDCESDPLPRVGNKWRAMKQIYRPWYVLNHFVHYSSVTKRIVDHPEQVSPQFIEKAPFERRVDELTEAFMLHTKTTPPEATRNWKRRCHSSTATSKVPCPVGIAFPLANHNAVDHDSNASHSVVDGMVCNCYQHARVQELVPKLEAALTLRRKKQK